jgi:hypothetical protein
VRKRLAPSNDLLLCLLGRFLQCHVELLLGQVWERLDNEGEQMLFGEAC